MSRNALTVVFPAAVALLVCSLVVLFLTATGLEPGPVLLAEGASGTANDSTVVNWCGTQSLGQQSTSLTPEEAAGDALFKANCAQCHAVNELVVGPALAGIDKRRPLPWLIKWVQNSSKVVASGDEYAVKIFNEFQKQQMPSFQLSETEIQNILLYIRSQQGQAASVPMVVSCR